MSITYKRAAEVLGMAVTFNGCGRTTSDEMREAVRAGVDALTEKAARTMLHPLTMPELRKMDLQSRSVKDQAGRSFLSYLRLERR